MTTERDELAGEIAGHQIGGTGYYSTCVGTPEALEIADAILAAGYRKPRTIVDHYADDGTDTLKPETVILSAGRPAIAQHDGTWMDCDGSTWDFWELELPVTVLWEPTDG